MLRTLGGFHGTTHADRVRRRAAVRARRRWRIVSIVSIPLLVSTVGVLATPAVSSALELGTAARCSSASDRHECTDTALRTATTSDAKRLRRDRNHGRKRAILGPAPISASDASPTSGSSTVSAPRSSSAAPTPPPLDSAVAPAPSLAAPSSPSLPAARIDPVSGFGVPFGSRPVSGAVGCSGRSGVTISGKTFRGIGSPTPAITIVGCHDVTIEGNDFIDVAEPIYVRDSTNVTIVWNRYRNITGPHTRDGSHRGNFTQWENSFGGRIAHNEGVGGDTEDIISIYASGGTSQSDPLLIEDNRFQGTNWTSGSGSGIMLGDGGGSHVIARNNILIDPGQVGIGIAGGSDIHVTGNTISGAARPGSNVGIYAWGQGTPCSQIEIAHNTIDFHKPDGTNSALWNAGNCGPITGLDSNAWNVPLDPAKLIPIW